MRVGIDYRILAVGEDLIQRGMGRYTQQQLRAVLAAGGADEYVLLCESDADLSLIDGAIRRAPNVVVRKGPARVGDPLSLRAAATYADWIDGLDLDVYHASTPFLFVEPVLADFDVCPVVATFYDLIPLLFPEHYLGAGAGYECYLWALGLVLHASRLLAISGASGADAQAHLGTPAERIDVAWPIADDCFTVLGADAVAEALAPLRRRFRVPEQFLLTVTYPHHSKNLETLFAAYATLPAAVRVRLPLVVCCHLPDKARAELVGLARALGFADDLVLTGRVSDAALAALYNAATLVVHPSRYEGFGLPVLEAMRCATPVVTTTSSSLPEVGGDAAVLVDPEDVAGMAVAIESVFDDPGLRDDMAARGLRHAARFDADQLAAATLDCYRRAAAGPVAGDAVGAVRPVRVALWTPVPPQQTGVADYGAELLDGLGEAADVEVFVDDGVLPPVDLSWAHRVQHFAAAPRVRRREPFDVAVYQLGASVYHRFLQAALVDDPGIVVVHDFRWGYLLWSEAVRTGQLDEFRRELEAEDGAAAVAELDGLDAPDGPFWDRHPLLGRVAGSSLALVVHSDAARQELELRYPDTRAYTVPMGVTDPYAAHADLDRGSARAALGIDPSTFVVGVFGIVHPAKQVEDCVEAFAGLVADHPDSQLLIVGRALDPAYERKIETLARDRGVLGAVRFTGHLDPSQLAADLVATDVVVNLRDTAIGQMSAMLPRVAAAGRAAVISDHPWWAGYPADACVRVTNGPGQAAAVHDALARLAADADLRAGMAAAARSWFETSATVAAMTEGYLDVIEAVCGRRRAGRSPRRAAATAGVRARLLAQAVR